MLQLFQRLQERLDIHLNILGVDQIITHPQIVHFPLIPFNKILRANIHLVQQLVIAQYKIKSTLQWWDFQLHLHFSIQTIPNL